MAVFKIEKNRDYTTISNHHLKNKNLSLKAKGLLTLLLSLPDDWEYSVAGLSKICKEGKDSITKAIKELETEKYIYRVQMKDEFNKFIGYEYNVFEFPFTEIPSTDFSSTDFSSTRTSSTENQQQLNTNISITKEVSTNKSNTYADLIDLYTENADLKNALKDFVKMRQKMKGFTVKALELSLSKLNKLAVDDYAKIEIVEQSIANSWKAFYPVKQTNQQSRNWNFDDF